jgi:hypothetical protein
MHTVQALDVYMSLHACFIRFGAELTQKTAFFEHVK